MDDVDAFRCPMHRTSKAESPFVWVWFERWPVDWLKVSLNETERSERE